MSESENNFYSQYVGEGSSPPPPACSGDSAEEDAEATVSPFDPLGGPHNGAASPSQSPEPEPPPYAPAPPTAETVAPLDSEGHTQIVDREQMRREMEILRNAKSPGAAPEENTAPYDHGASVQRPWDRAAQASDGGRHTAPPPPPPN
ncbi:hypothetical protein ABH36_18895, partial [Mycobacterium haemophilum]